MLKRFSSDQRGATAIEYGLIAALIAVVLLAAIGGMTTRHAKLTQPAPAASAPLKN